MTKEPAADRSREHPDDEPEWTDLAANRPGQVGDQHAAELRRRAPFRSVVSRVLDLRTEERQRRLVALAERRVARELAHLPRTWHVLHSVPVEHSETGLDHLVVGPAGVYLLDSKLHPDGLVLVDSGSFRVNGALADDVTVVRRDAQVAAELLTAACRHPVVVHGVVVVIGGELRIRRQPDDVTVVTRKQVATWLRRRPRSLTNEEVAEVYAMARRSTTWRRA